MPTTNFYSNDSSQTSESALKSLARDESKIIRGPWADGPWPLIETPSRTQQIIHPIIHIANEMAHAHNAALRGLNSIFIQAPHVTATEDITDILFLTHCWSVWALNKHILRQTRIFPEFEAILEKPNALRSTIEGDLDIVPCLEDLGEYAENTLVQPGLYDSAVLQTLIEELAPGLRAHFASQILTVANLTSLCGEPGSPEAENRAARLLQVHLSCEAEASNAMDRFIVPPMLMRLRDTTFEGGNNWPGLSVLAVHAIDDRLSSAHAGAWRFLPCDVWGKPRELPFLGYDDRRRKGKAKVVFSVAPESQLSVESVAPVTLDEHNMI